jgi:hypothetical protein
VRNRLRNDADRVSRSPGDVKKKSFKSQGHNRHRSDFKPGEYYGPGNADLSAGGLACGCQDFILWSLGVSASLA